MKIAHICLSCFFIDGRSYQENELVRQHVSDGHTVLVIASTETHSETGSICYTNPGEYVGTEGAIVRRLPYRKILPHRVMTKLRMNVGTYKALAQFRPDVILFHGTCGWELRNVGRYAKDQQNVPLFVDSHEDWNNSARGLIAREILHRRYYGPILRSVMPQIRKVLCVSTESMEFVSELYRIPKEDLEFYPLGGHPVDDAEYVQRRKNVREEYGISDSDILLIQSGKQTKRKKLIESLRAFAAHTDQTLRFLVVGVLQDDIREEVEALIAADDRVTYLGWVSPDQLTDLLCAADVYVQPGTQSVTMQHSLCCRCAVILDDVPAHRVYHLGNGWLLNEAQSISEVFGRIRDADLRKLGSKSYAIACNMLDYKKLSLRILQ